MAKSIKIQGMVLTLDCEMPYTISPGGSTLYEVFFQTPEWTITGTLGSYTTIQEYTITVPMAETITDALILALEAKINNVAATDINTATALMAVLQDILNSETILDILDAALNVEHKRAYNTFIDFQAQIDLTSGVYAVITAPTEPGANQAATNIITSNNNPLTATQSYSHIEAFLD